MNNKGISTIIATILMILFVIIGSGIVWVVIQNVLTDKTNEISEGSSNIILNIGEVNSIDTNIEVLINRDIGKGNLKKIKILFYDNTGKSYSKDVDATTLGELEKDTFDVAKSDIASKLTDVEKVAVAPIIESGNGQETLQRITYTYTLETPISLS